MSTANQNATQALVGPMPHACNISYDEMERILDAAFRSAPSFRATFARDVSGKEDVK